MKFPKIIYWTTACLEPEIEAISKEVYTLANHFRPSFIFSISPHFPVRFSFRYRFIGFNSKLYPLLRIIVPILEQWADINHVYGEISPWLYYKALCRKPIVHTIASEKGQPVGDYLDRCKAIIVQTTRMRQRLLDIGINPEKIHLIHPGVDLNKFKPAKKIPPFDKPKILFASAPRSEEELEARGVYFLVEVAKLLPEISFTFLFRKWAGGYTSLSATEKLLKKNQLKNVKVLNRKIGDMGKIYPQHHFTIIPFTAADGGKECPNSAIESISCGVPILVSKATPLAKFVSDYKCGSVFPLEGAELIATIYQSIEEYKVLRKNCIILARERFSRELCLSLYKEIYQSILSKSGNSRILSRGRLGVFRNWMASIFVNNSFRYAVRNGSC